MIDATIILVAALALLAAAAVAEAADPSTRPAAAAPPLPYRIVSFHGGRADKELVKLAAELGFNGVMIQTEEGTVGKLEDFAAYDRREQLVRYCHELGMQVTLWVHELADLPPEMAAGGITPENDALWQLLDARYERFLKELLPQVDGLVLTVVETQVRATDPAILNCIVEILHAKCRKYGKTLIVRTFVWTMDEFNAVMAAVKGWPDDIVIMTKCVPQDWHLRSIDDPALGAMGQHRQIEEFDVAGEYFGLNKLTNCMPELLARQLESGLRKGIDGICVRVDRGAVSILDEPMEVNLWALGLLASGKAKTPDEAWHAWAEHRYGPAAAAGVIRALKGSTEVVQEIQYVDRLMFGNIRSMRPPAPQRETFSHNADVWKWDASFVPMYKAALAGEPGFMAKLEQDKARAAELAARALVALEAAKPSLPDVEYQILHHKLLTNQVQLTWRGRAQLAYLRNRRRQAVADAGEKAKLTEGIRGDLAAIRQAVAATDQGRTVEHRGRTWHVGTPGTDRDLALGWAEEMERALAE